MVSVAFSSHAAARAARDRLARAGFARNSVDIARHGDGFEVSISTSEENSARAERILTRRGLGGDLRRAGTKAVETWRGNRTIALGLAAFAGFALFGLTRRR